MKPFEMETDRIVDELRTEMRAGFAQLEVKIDSLRPSPWHTTELAIARFERRVTKRLFWFHMTLGVANAAIIIGMLGLLR